MEPWADDSTDDLQSMSFNSTATSTITTDHAINRTTSSSSETTFTASSSNNLLGGCSSFSTKLPHYFSHDDPCSQAIRRVTHSESPPRQLVLSDLRFVHKLGCGDIGAVYLAELKQDAERNLFAAKVMDKKELASRNKEGRARTEREILEMLDHPFFPTLYAALESPKWLCLLTEFCPGGDLHVLRQRQPCKRFDESAGR